MPVYLLRFHSPCFSAAFAGAMCRAAASMRATASSAAETMFEVGALTTMTPFWVAAFTSTLSSPTPARATTLSCLAAASASASTFVALRTRMASTSTMAGRSSARSAPLQRRISKSGPSASTVAGLSSSAMSTTGLLTRYPSKRCESACSGSAPRCPRERPRTTLCPRLNSSRSGSSRLVAGGSPETCRRCLLGQSPCPSYRPDVVEVVGDPREQRAVVLRVLADQRRPVAAVERRITQPWRESLRRGELGLGPDVADPVLGEVGRDGRRAGVGEPALAPDLAAGEGVARQRLLVALPHQHRRMVTPAVARADEPAQDLDALDALLAKAALVEHPGGLLEVGVGQEGLHGRWVPLAGGAQTTPHFPRRIVASHGKITMGSDDSPAYLGNPSPAERAGRARRQR